MDRLTQRLREQLDAFFGGNESELARHIGTDPQNINNFMSGRVKSSKYWREIGSALRIDDGEMQALMAESKRGRNTKLPKPFTVSDYFPDMPKPNAKILPMQQSQPAQVRMIPVLGEAVGGEDGEYAFNGQALDYVPCPPSLANVPNAYVIFIDGESMVPRYMPGEVAFVHPGKPVRRGDHVVVQVKPNEEGAPPRGFVKKFVGWTSTKLFLEQYNPAKKLEFLRNHVISVHLIVLAGDY